jgi:hypothetical protein
MATNSAMMIEWGTPMAGREKKAIEEFAAHMQWWNELKGSGRVAEFRVYGPLTGNIEERAGFVILEGTSQQINELRASDDFRTRYDRVVLVGNNIQTTLCETGDAMMTRIQRYGKSVKDVLG